MPERIKIVIHPNQSGADLLKIEDAMNQVLDLFALAALENESEKEIGWNLVSANANSPFTIEGEAYGIKGDPVDEIARNIKLNLVHNLSQLEENKIPALWATGPGNSIAKRLFKRNTNGIGRTDIYFDQKRVTQLTPQIAKEVEWLLSKPIDIGQADKARMEYGSIEGLILEVGTHYNKPAIKIRERLTDSDIWCIIPDEVSELVAETTNFEDVWKNRRIIVKGSINYGTQGKIDRIIATGLERVPSKNVKLSEILDKDFTRGLSPEEYLDKFREGGLG